jgi:hypothetical protein
MTTKPRKKAAQVQIEHVVLGPCRLIERRATATGNDILLVELPDKSTRQLLADPKFWLTLPDLAAIPVANKAGAPDESDDEPEIERDDVEGDVEPELIG